MFNIKVSDAKIYTCDDDKVDLLREHIDSVHGKGKWFPYDIDIAGGVCTIVIKIADPEVADV